MVNAGFAWKVAWLTWAFVLSRVIAVLAFDATGAGLVVASVSAPPGARGGAHADAPSVAERRALDRVLEGSGLKGQLEILSTGVRAQFLLSAQTNPDRVTIDRIVSTRFDAEALYARIRLELGQNLDAVKLATALAWYDSTLGKRITALELAATRPEAGRGASRGLDKNRPSPRRLALIERLDLGLGASETTVDVTMTVVRSLVRAFQPSLPAVASLSPQQLDEQLALTRNRTLDLLRPVYRASMLVAYRGLSDSELADYVQFVESEAGRWYMSQTNSALLKAADVAAAATAVELAIALPPLAAELR
jgi:hypothetical protein